MILNRVVWIFLVVLTLVGYMFSDPAISGPRFAFVLLILYGVKFIAVAMQFLEVKTAHPFWKVLILGTAFVFVASFSMMY